MLIFAFLLPITFGFSNPVTTEYDGCPAPSNLTYSTPSYDSIIFDWDDCDCSQATYQVYYVRGGVTSQTYSVSGSTITFSNLTDGEYRFYFFTDCGTGTSNLIIEEILIV